MHYKFSDVFTPVITMAIIIVSPLVFFLNVLKLLKSSLRIRRTNRQKKLTTGQLVYFQINLKFMKDLCMILWVITLMMFYQNFSAVSEEVLVLKTVYYMIETIRKTRDSHGVFAAIMTDLSKAFDCISHELLIAKLNAYGFGETSFKMTISYLKIVCKLLK